MLPHTTPPIHRAKTLRRVRSAMRRPVRKSGWAKSIERSFKAATRMVATSGTRALAKTLKPAVRRRKPPAGVGTWVPGVAIGAAGARRFQLYRPPGIQAGERLPLMVMLHGCGQDALHFAASTRMNRIATRERFLVLYPEQDRLANANGCWNWFDTDSGRAYGEAALIMNAIDQVCLMQPIDKSRVGIAGLSAGASMATLMATRYPDRFKAVVMHSGIPPGTAHSTLSALGAMRGHRPTQPLATTPGTVAVHWPPLLVIHGTADGVVSPHNGEAATQTWATAAGAGASAPRRVQRGKRYPMTVTDFKRKGRTVATLVAVDGLTHAWSGGTAREAFSDARGPDASRMAWAFVAKQFGTQASMATAAPVRS